MKKLLIALILLLPTLASAQTLGCYMENTRTYCDECSTQTITCGASKVLNLTYLGLTLGTVCNQLIDENERANHNYTVWEQCTKDRDYNAGGWNECAAGWQGTVSLLAANNGLVKRLRRACGTKCKRIK